MDLTSLTYLTSFWPFQRRFLNLCSADQSSRDLERLERLERLRLERLVHRAVRRRRFHLAPWTLQSGLLRNLRNLEIDRRITLPGVRSVDSQYV